MWQNWINAVLGIWVIIVPYLGMSDSGETTTLIITGAAILIFAIWGAMDRSAMRA